MIVNLDWDNLGFVYRKLLFWYILYFKDGKWDDGKLIDDVMLYILESFFVFYYG